MSTWLSKKALEETKSAQVFIVDDKEDLSEVLGPCAAFDEFKTDLALRKTFVFYHPTTKKRCLLGFSSSVTPKDSRALAKKVCTELQALKVSAAVFVFSASFSTDCCLGHFINEFANSNYMRKRDGEDAKNVASFDY